MKKRTLIGKITYLIVLILLFVAVYFAYQYYQKNNFNDFLRSETNLNLSKFTRDSEEKYDDKKSYKITSEDYNDAMFCKKIDVEKNQPYKVSCMVKTRGVMAKEQNSGVGAQISIGDSTERSIALQGDNDWQKIELIVNSKDRDSLNIGFRLGGYLGDAKGEVWFSNFEIEEGIAEKNNNWKFACFILKNTDVILNGKETSLKVTNNDILDIKNTLNRFETSCQTLSKNKMEATCDTYEIDAPLTQLSYDDEFGYYVSPENVETQIKDIVSQGDYDHIFVVVRLGDDEHENDIEVNDWIGLRINGLLWNRIFKYKIAK